MSTGTLNELIKKLSPAQYNSIIVDNAVAVKRHDYCYIHAEVQSLEFRSDSVTVATDKYLAQEIMSLCDRYDGNSYIVVDGGMIDRIKKAQRATGQGLLDGARRRMNELINGGYEVDVNKLKLDTDGKRIALKQPFFAVKEGCTVSSCPDCKGSGTVDHADRSGLISRDECSCCGGSGNIGKFTWLSTTVRDKQATFVHCLGEPVAGLKDSVIERHKGGDATPRRMLTRFNGFNVEEYDEALRPCLDMIHDRVGENNAVEDIYFHIIPCYTFSYRNVLTGELRAGVLVDPYGEPELLMALDGSGRKFINGISNSVKNISHFFAGLGNSGSYRDKEDLRRTVRLLIAVVVADGEVNDEEKKTLALALRGMEVFTTEEQEGFVELLGSKDGTFLTDDDFVFSSMTNREETLARLQELSAADGMVHELERDIIERLQFKY